MKRRKIAVAGGGAAGMAAAVSAAWEGAEVTVFERNDRLGRKILSTGNGKCNLGNLELSARQYHSSSAEGERIERFLGRFGAEDTVRFFRRLGLLVKEKNGYLYPVCEQASAVLDVLRAEVGALGIRVVTGAEVRFLERLKDGLWEVGAGEHTMRFDGVILTCGGRAAPATGSDGSGFKLAERLGLEMVPTVPALVQLLCREQFCRALAGVRAEAAVRILDGGREIACERGELQMTDYGISGIPVFQLSRTVNYRLRERGEVTAVIDFLPDFTEKDYSELCAERLRMAGERTAEQFFTGLLHKKLMTLFIKLAGLKAGLPMSAAPVERVMDVFGMCRGLTLHVTGSKPYENAQVCAGGVSLKEITEDFGAGRAPGLYLAGEILDVDGRCGGYNLQWAWTSGILAGRAAGREG